MPEKTDRAHEHRCPDYDDCDRYKADAEIWFQAHTAALLARDHYKAALEAAGDELKKYGRGNITLKRVIVARDIILRALNGSYAPLSEGAYRMTDAQKDGRVNSLDKGTASSFASADSKKRDAPKDGRAPYVLTVRVDGKVEHTDQMVDPFLVSTTHVKRRAWWRVLLHGLSVEISVNADPETVERVMELGPDYIGPPGSKSRGRWNKELDAALHDFAERLPDD